jgi:ABC-type Fe3+/spermidine/putrescine transport system ATPase subunit
MRDPAASACILELRNIGVRFGEVEAVRDVSLDVSAGEFVSLLGPSGCGKSTLLRTIAGYTIPHTGEIRLNGAIVTAAPPQVRRIGMVFQNYALFPHMLVADNIAFGLRRQGKPRAEVAARVAEMLALVRLDGFGARRPAELSGGQQQRVALARALAFRPQLLLLDEPLAALDLHLRESMQLEIKRVQRQTGVTTIFVTHDQGEALALSDRVAVMNAGRIEQLDTPRGLYQRPSSAFVASFVGRSNLLAVEVTSLTDDTIGLLLGETRLELPSAAAPDRPAIGQRCWLTIRPEHVVLAARGTATIPLLTGIVERVAFQGTHQNIGIRTSAGAELSVRANADFRIGELVDIAWKPLDARLLAALDG